MSLETDVEDPDQSPVFSKDPEFLKDAHVRHFFCDSMRMAISGVFDLDELMEGDLEVQHHEAHSNPFFHSPAWRTRCPGSELSPLYSE
jgi:chemotaxis protein MotA